MSSQLVKGYCEFRLREIEEDMYPPIPGTPADYIRRAVTRELKKILKLESGDHSINELITIWEPARPGYIWHCTFAKWDGECWVRHIPTNISKSKTSEEVWAEIGKRSEFGKRNDNFKKDAGVNT